MVVQDGQTIAGKYRSRRARQGGTGSGDDAEQAAANEKQAESPALPPPPVLSHLSGSACIFLSPDCREIGGFCAGEVWLVNGWPGAESPDTAGLGCVLQTSRSPAGAGFKVWEGLGGRDTTLALCTRAEKGTGSVGCCLPRYRSGRNILGASGWEWQHPI